MIRVGIRVGKITAQIYDRLAIAAAGCGTQVLRWEMWGHFTRQIQPRVLGRTLRERIARDVHEGLHR